MARSLDPNIVIRKGAKIVHKSRDTQPFMLQSQAVKKP
jgi:hypothetical protein